MGMGDDMRNLVQEIRASHGARADRLAALRRETTDMLNGFRWELGEMATGLRRFLGNAESARMQCFRAMLEGIKARQRERNQGTHDLMASFQREREAMAAYWRNMAASMAKKRAGVTR
jgi:hypothetical protein